MDIERFLSGNGIDEETQLHYRLITTIKNTTGKHCHDFFEFFLILSGKAMHCINNEKQLLEEGALVFIRPDDVHYYEPLSGYDFQFINLSFYSEIMNSLFDYLGDGFRKDDLLNSAMPPTVMLSVSDMDYVRNRLEHLNLIPSSRKDVIRTAGRAIISEIFSMFFLDYKAENTGRLPDLLYNLCTVMKKKENFTAGLPAMLSISGRTHEHLCRLFKKHLQITPTEYINDLRLNYVENLLINSDMEIVNICFAAGFENLGYFYKLYKKRFNQAPYAYRKKNKKDF